MASPPHSAADAGTDDYEARLMEALATPPPPGFRALGARVEHLLAHRAGPLAAVVAEALQLPQARRAQPAAAADLLLRFGAIHTCPVPPTVPPDKLAEMGAEEAERVQRTRLEALQRAGNSTKAQTPQRAREGAQVDRHAYIRVHVHPKRFPAAHAVDWRERVVAATDEYAVISKPGGVPAAPTVDNWLECAPACAAQALGAPQPLLVTSRLDQCTEGLLVLGRTKRFVTRFNELVQRSSGGGGAAADGDGSSGAASCAGGGPVAEQGAAAGGRPRPLRKFYRAATAGPPPLGRLRHHLSIERRQPGLPNCTIAHERPVQGSLLAELVVLEVQPIRLAERAAGLWGGEAAHECLIELLTGRTHQIRAQLSAAGCPLLGDSLYQPLACPQLRQRLFAGDPCSDLQPAAGSRVLEEPGGGIGLQACRLLVADECMGGSEERPAEFTAGPPWWRA